MTKRALFVIVPVQRRAMLAPPVKVLSSDGVVGAMFLPKATELPPDAVASPVRTVTMTAAWMCVSLWRKWGLYLARCFFNIICSVSNQLGSL